MLTHIQAKRLFKYINGVLYWKVSPSTQVKTGDPAGCLDCYGYLCTKVKGKRYKNHRIVWLLIYGYLPENKLDHIDRNRANNTIENLREVSHSCNLIRKQGD